MPAAAASRGRWSGRVITAVPVAFLVFDATLKLFHIPAVAQASQALGWPNHLNSALGLLILACLVLYLVPRTAVIGAVLLTGYLGGAVAVHLRVGDSLFGQTLFPTYVGVLLWSGLFLRDRRVRAAIGKVID